MTVDGSRRDPGRRVSLGTVADEPVRMTVRDVAGNPVEGARVDALVCGWRTAEPAGAVNRTGVTVAYCQWAVVGRVTDESGVVDLGPVSSWRIDAGAEEQQSAVPAPPGIDPGAEQRLAPAGAGVTRLLGFARHDGPEHDWLGARRLPVGAAIEQSRTGDGPTVTLDRKWLFGGEPLVTDLTSDDAVDAPDYQYGTVNLWHRVSGEDRPHRLVAEVRAGVQNVALGTPGQFPDLEEELYPTVDAFGPAVERENRGAANQVERAGSLQTGRLALDIEERPAPGEEPPIEILADGAESFDGVGRERVRSYFPQTPRFADADRYALSNAVAFELNTTPSTGRSVVSGNPSNSPPGGGGLPLYPAVTDVFTEWRPGVDDEESDGGGSDPVTSAARSVVNTLAGEAGDEIADRANYSRGVLAGKGLSKAATAYSGISAFGALFEQAVDEPENDLGEGPPFDPNRTDQILTQWDFSPGRRRMAAVLEVPFQFTGDSEARVRLRGGWGVKFRDVSSPSTDRIKTDRVRVTDRRVPQDGGGST